VSERVSQIIREEMAETIRLITENKPASTAWWMRS
jgi:hypothetical protein